MKLQQLPLVLFSFYSIFCASYAYSSINDTCFNGGVVTNANFTNNLCTFIYTDSTGLTYAYQFFNGDANLNATTCTNENVLSDIKKVGSVNSFRWAAISKQGGTTYLDCVATVNGENLAVSNNTVVGVLPSNSADWTNNTLSKCESSIESCSFSYLNSSTK